MILGEKSQAKEERYYMVYLHVDLESYSREAKGIWGQWRVSGLR